MQDIPAQIFISSYSHMRDIVNWALSETKERRLQIADAIVPPEYAMDSLPESYSTIWKKFNALSGATMPFDYQDKIFEFYTRLFAKGQECERQGQLALALDYYLLTVFNCCPTGTLYYERPAILLEKQHRYILVLILCDLGKRAYFMSNGNLPPDFDKRRSRVLSKLKRANVSWPHNKYPIAQPPMPSPWIRPVIKGYSTEYFDAWSRGEIKDYALDADFKKWKMENKEGLENFYP